MMQCPNSIHISQSTSPTTKAKKEKRNPFILIYHSNLLHPSLTPSLTRQRSSSHEAARAQECKSPMRRLGNILVGNVPLKPKPQLETDGKILEVRLALCDAIYVNPVIS